MKRKHLAIKTTLTAIICVFAVLVVHAQYKGGDNDGNAVTASVSTNVLPNIYKGGKNDGTAKAQVSNSNTIANIYKGGSNDGTSSTGVFFINVLSNIYAGGNNDGTAVTSSNNNNPLINIYAGGVNDGTAVVIAFKENNVFNIYNGGNDDGFATTTLLLNNPLSNIYKGGSNDGMAALLSNGQNPMTLLAPQPKQSNNKSSYNGTEQPDKTAALQRYTIYPNPGNGIFNIDIKGVKDFSSYHYRVMAGDGKLIREGNIANANTQFDISRSADGVYYVQLLSKNEFINTYKIILQH